MATLVSNNAETGISRVELQDGINTIGRAEGNHHIIRHASVSSRHCEIVVNNGAIAVRDLGSTNGTFIDDKQVQEARVAHGQRLRFGAVEFVVEAPEAQSSRSGTLRVNVVRPVSTVETAEAPPIARTANAAIAAINVAAHEQRSFYRRLPGAFAYPFNKSGIIMLVLGAILFLVLDFLSGFRAGIRGSLFSTLITVISTGYMFAYMQKIIAHSAQGEDELPDFPDVTEWWSDIILPFLLFTGTAVVSFAPAIAAAVVLRESEMLLPAVIAALIFGAIYFPMALLAVAVSDNFLALSPHIVVPSMFRVFVPYLVICVMLGVLVGIRFGLAIAMSFVPIPLLPAVVMGFISLYLLTVEMRVLGLLFNSYRARLGWLG